MRNWRSYQPSYCQASEDGVGIYFCEMNMLLRQIIVPKTLENIGRYKQESRYKSKCFNIHKIFSWDIVTFIISKFLR